MFSNFSFFLREVFVEMLYTLNGIQIIRSLKPLGFTNFFDHASVMTGYGIP